MHLAVAVIPAARLPWAFRRFEAPSGFRVCGVSRRTSSTSPGLRSSLSPPKGDHRLCPDQPIEARLEVGLQAGEIVSVRADPDRNAVTAARRSSSSTLPAPSSAKVASPARWRRSRTSGASNPLENALVTCSSRARRSRVRAGTFAFLSLLVIADPFSVSMPRRREHVLIPDRT